MAIDIDFVYMAINQMDNYQYIHSDSMFFLPKLPTWTVTENYDMHEW